MDETRKRLHRTNDGIIAGVASGLAHYLGTDPAIMRLIFIVLTVLTSGFFVLIYIALWLVLPKDGSVEAPVDVHPDSAQSARNCACGSPCKEAKATTEGVSPLVTVGLVLGVFMVCFGMAFLFTVIDSSFSIVEFWPLPVIALGIVRLALPGRSGYTVYGIVEGAVLCIVGIIMLLTTTGVLSMRMADWFRDNWSLLAIAAGLLILGHSMKSPALLVAAVCVVAVFCAMGLAMYALAGPANDVWMPMPYGQIAPDGQDAGSAVAWLADSGEQAGQAAQAAQAAAGAVA